MKKAILAALALAVAFFLFSGRSVAEQEDDGQTVTKIYDLSVFFIKPVGFPGPNIDITDNPPEPPVELPKPEDALTQIKTLAGWTEADDPDAVEFIYDYKLTVCTSPARIRDFDRAIETLFPKPWSHNVTLLLATRDDGAAPPAMDPALGFTDALTSLKKQGFSTRWFGQLSLLPGRTSVLWNGRDISYVAGQEALIATFSRSFSPIVKYRGFGSLIQLKYHDLDKATTIDVYYREARLKEMKSSIQNGNEIQLPVIAYNDWRRQLVFSRPGIQTIGYYFDGTACVLLIELEE
ncbi:MAG: hypothetical protein WC712_02870 [Candidatus Brocadiia bacterium]